MFKQKFLKLINKHFPRHHKFYKLLNKNNVKPKRWCCKNMHLYIKKPMPTQQKMSKQ